MSSVHRALSGSEEDLLSFLATLAEQDSRFWDGLDKESDRGVVLVAGAYFENVLLHCLHAYFLECASSKELLSPSGGLGTAAARIQCCRALRIIDENDARRLSLISKIRNKFAHDLMTDFSERKILSLVEELMLETERPLGSDIRPESTKARDIFCFCAWWLSLDLQRREFEVRRHTLAYSEIIPYSLRDFMEHRRRDDSDTTS